MESLNLSKGRKHTDIMQEAEKKGRNDVADILLVVLMDTKSRREGRADLLPELFSF